MQISLLGYIPEYYSESTGKSGAVKYIRDFICDVRDPARLIHHTPDAVFALEKDGNPALFFLEIDRGTEVVNDPEKGFLKSFHFYLNYFVDGKYQKYSEDFRCSAVQVLQDAFCYYVTGEVRQHASGGKGDIYRPAAGEKIYLAYD